MTTLAYMAAANYGCDAYGSGAYGQCSPTGSLVNTGYDVLLPIFLGVSMIGAALILIIKRALRRKQKPEPTA